MVRQYDSKLLVQINVTVNRFLGLLEGFLSLLLALYVQAVELLGEHVGGVFVVREEKIKSYCGIVDAAGGVQMWRYIEGYLFCRDSLSLQTCYVLERA